MTESERPEEGVRSDQSPNATAFDKNQQDHINPYDSIFRNHAGVHPSGEHSLPAYSAPAWSLSGSGFSNPYVQLADGNSSGSFLAEVDRNGTNDRTEFPKNYPGAQLSAKRQRSRDISFSQQKKRRIMQPHTADNTRATDGVSTIHNVYAPYHSFTPQVFMLEPTQSNAVSKENSPTVPPPTLHTSPAYTENFYQQASVPSWSNSAANGGIDSFRHWIQSHSVAGFASPATQHSSEGMRLPREGGNLNEESGDASISWEMISNLSLPSIDDWSTPGTPRNEQKKESVNFHNPGTASLSLDQAEAASAPSQSKISSLHSQKEQSELERNHNQQVQRLNMVHQYILQQSEQSSHNSGAPHLNYTVPRIPARESTPALSLKRDLRINVDIPRFSKTVAQESCPSSHRSLNSTEGNIQKKSSGNKNSPMKRVHPSAALSLQSKESVGETAPFSQHTYHVGQNIPESGRDFSRDSKFARNSVGSSMGDYSARVSYTSEQASEPTKDIHPPQSNMQHSMTMNQAHQNWRNPPNTSSFSPNVSAAQSSSLTTQFLNESRVARNSYSHTTGGLRDFQQQMHGLSSKISDTSFSSHPSYSPHPMGNALFRTTTSSTPQSHFRFSAGEHFQIPNRSSPVPTLNNQNVSGNALYTIPQKVQECKLTSYTSNAYLSFRKTTDMLDVRQDKVLIVRFKLDSPLSDTPIQFLDWNKNNKRRAPPNSCFVECVGVRYKKMGADSASTWNASEVKNQIELKSFTPDAETNSVDLTFKLPRTQHQYCNKTITNRLQVVFRLHHLPSNMRPCDCLQKPPIHEGSFTDCGISFVCSTKKKGKQFYRLKQQSSLDAEQHTIDVKRNLSYSRIRFVLNNGCVNSLQREDD